MAVLMGLAHYAEVCRGEQGILKLLLPISASLKEDLNLAASGQKGFLMQDQEKVARGQSATVILATRTGK